MRANDDYTDRLPGRFRLHTQDDGKILGYYLVMRLISGEEDMILLDPTEHQKRRIRHACGRREH